ncbi:FYVE zinc finger-domain-containing protein [Calycina marina]|uniref:FYVE zinc finger-domain-containing protein n=1 Tax=Calycina marina TaxID=1763456 RepID=A0A9P7YUZ1_9HELO|nr:FYVE zinc finger-domain-containing protein [Calycina marina]
MSARKLGGGRILGSGKGLAPPPPAHQRRTSDLVSPSESTISVSSRDSSGLATSPLPDSSNNLSAAVSLQNGGSVVTPASSKLVCPICNEEMMTLLQLNRHLDDNHRELPAVAQDEVKNWFDKQVVKAKKFQPIAVLNQKLKGLDVFESNDTATVAFPTPTAAAVNRTVPPEHRPDPDEVVTRTHWQRPGYNDLCTEPSCGKRLGSVNGNVNCRKCGRLFCEDHTMYQMKLSRSAQHEPVRGFWCRTCETCYKSKEGYNDRNGFSRDHTKSFAFIRSKKVDKTYLEISRLEKRLTKLTQLLANPPEDTGGNGGGMMSLAGGQKNQRKLLEQSVVAWEEDAKVTMCPFCHQEFGQWTFRRHHCRVCGRVVCADIRTGCSSEIGLNVTATTNPSSEKPSSSITLDVRMCRDCKATIFSKKDFESELQHKPPDQRAYENLLQFEKGIRLLLPNFQRLLMALQDPEKPPLPAQLSEASKVRKRLIDSFGKYDMAARRIRDLPTLSPTQSKLQTAIYQQVASFLNLHMLPLKTLPKILKHASPHGSNGLPNGRSALANIKYNDIDNSSIVSSSSAVSAMESEERELRERLIVLEEQKFMVSEMIADANKRRKFDEMSALSVNRGDLDREIDAVQGMIAQLDFAGIYSREQANGTAPMLEVRR